MDRETILKLAREAGFNWPEITTVPIEQRLERFAAAVCAWQRERDAKILGAQDTDPAFKHRLATVIRGGE